MSIADKAVFVTGGNRRIGQPLEEAIRGGARRAYAGKALEREFAGSVLVL